MQMAILLLVDLGYGIFIFRYWYIQIQIKNIEYKGYA